MKYREVKCPKCSWVHAEIPSAYVSDANMAAHLQCFQCGESTVNFVPAQPGDAPMGCTLQSVVLPTTTGVESMDCRETK
jgi:hypothetical protein